MLLLILGALAPVVVGPADERRGPRDQMVQGTLLVTGVSASSPDRTALDSSR